MKKIGVLYICTGKYVLFWEDFYKSFEEKFLNDCELHYFVFTDADSIYGENNNNRIHRTYIDTWPWPLVTLFRFKTFLMVEDELKKMDYLMFSNSNMVCDDIITAEEFLPRKELGEELFVTIHPGYQNVPMNRTPLDRNKESYAYVPYNKGKNYVIGAMNGGTSEGFLKMCHTLDRAIDEDLKHNTIARWHDESHLNRYIIDRNDVRVLEPSYCYPWGMDVPYPKKISAVSKQAKFDVKDFKGFYKVSGRELFNKRVKAAKIRIKETIGRIWDIVTAKKVRPYNFE